jgi:hypothetical protein
MQTDHVTKESLLVNSIKEILRTHSATGNESWHGPNHVGCRTACYQCMHRYDNQHYHGLIDWRLGLDVLQMMVTPDYEIGFNSDLTSLPSKNWLSLARDLADEAATLRGYPSGQSVAGLPAFQLRGESNVLTGASWAVVTHPLWDYEALLEANEPLAEFDLSCEAVIATNTFKLARGLGKELIRLNNLLT